MDISLFEGKLSSWLVKTSGKATAQHYCNRETDLELLPAPVRRDKDDLKLLARRPQLVVGVSQQRRELPAGRAPVRTG